MYFPSSPKGRHCIYLPETFLYHGKVIMGIRDNISLTTTNKRFRAWFGTSIQVCAIVWNLIPSQRRCGGSAPFHLLWSLLLMKDGSNQEVLASMVSADPKTFRKWAWTFISLIYELESNVVRNKNIIIYILILTYNLLYF